MIFFQVESSIEEGEKTVEVKQEKTIKQEKLEKKAERRQSVKERRESARREKRDKKLHSCWFCIVYDNVDIKVLRML